MAPGAEEVQQGVRAAVEAHHGLPHFEGDHDDVHELAVLGHVDPHEQVDGPGDVVGHETHHEHGAHGQEGAQGLVARTGGPGVADAVRGPAVQRLHHGEVTGDDDEEGDQKPHYGQKQSVGEVSFKLRRVGHFEAHGPVVDHPRVRKSERGCNLRGGQDPNWSWRKAGDFPGPDAHGGDGEAHSDEAVHADAGEEHHAAVEVDVEEEPDALADEVAEGPQAPHGVADDEDGQAEHVQEVRHGQVGQVDDRAAPAARPAADAPQQGAVQTQAQEEDEAVGDREKEPLVLAGHWADLEAIHSKWPASVEAFKHLTCLPSPVCLWPNHCVKMTCDLLKKKHTHTHQMFAQLVRPSPHLCDAKPLWHQI